MRLVMAFLVLGIASTSYAGSKNGYPQNGYSGRQFSKKYVKTMRGEYSVAKSVIESVRKFVRGVNRRGDVIQQEKVGKTTTGYRTVSASGKVERILAYSPLTIGHFKQITKPGMTNMIIPTEKGFVSVVEAKDSIVRGRTVRVSTAIGRFKTAAEAAAAAAEVDGKVIGKKGTTFVKQHIEVLPK